MFSRLIAADIHISNRVEVRLRREGLWRSLAVHQTVYGEGDMCVTHRGGTEIKG